jgi:hypothetical protein
MATRVAWLLNLDADSELADPRRYRPPAGMAQRVRELAPRMTMLVRPDDVLLEGRADEAELARELPVLAFCPTPGALERLALLGRRPAIAPGVEVLRRVNDRAFSAALGQTMPGARFVHTLAELEATIRGPSPTGSFLIKRPFGFAGRERRRADGGQLDPSTLGFVQRSFARGEGLQIEPWVERRGDFSRHGWVREAGPALFGPLVRQDCDVAGRWQGARLAEPAALSDAEAELLQAELERSAEALHAAGYRGPFGVDAFRYVAAAGATALAPRCEINARFTMGFPRELLERALADQ